ncbi:MAG: ATPase, T2SS/T4P/T4SS family [Candidatus Omnitrophica bacterium]|nr:ATPase, T2SS/T4P/T4SS family [Candidatus Omnitrophota bacterium]MDD5653564.1 ATPase, T2SS/T4P/T4SS family [Candidatus Omnitrophota bacterium]
MERDKIEFENQVLDRLAEKSHLFKDFFHKREIIFQEFSDFCRTSKFNHLCGANDGSTLENFFNGVFSFDIIDEFLNDSDVEDIIINGLSPIYVHKTSEGLVKSSRHFSSAEELGLFVKKLFIFSDRKDVKKINNLELPQIKGRVNIVYSPFGPQLTITRAKEKPLSIITLIEKGTINAQIAAQLWLYIEGLGIKPANMIIAGGPGSGKTTLLNALFSFIPADQRIVVIEDTLELNTDLEGNFSRLESDDEISLADLVKNSLRMRMDRVVIGEVRGSEAKDLMTAMNIGKYCMGTLHASSGREAVIRLEHEPMNVPSILINLVDVFVIMNRYNLNNKIQRVVSEVVETAGMEKQIVLLSPLWACDLSTLKFRQSQVSSGYRDKLAAASGKSVPEIIGELKQREDLLQLLIDKGIRENKEVSRILQLYIKNPKSLSDELGFPPK